MLQLNPRYLAYCRANGNTYAAQRRKDQEEWPGGAMAGYISFISRMRAAFFKAHPEAWVGRAIRDHSAFTRFITRQVDLQTVQTGAKPMTAR